MATTTAMSKNRAMKAGMVELRRRFSPKAEQAPGHGLGA
jgi:hypothetical protein